MRTAVLILTQRCIDSKSHFVILFNLVNPVKKLYPLIITETQSFCKNGSNKNFYRRECRAAERQRFFNIVVKSPHAEPQSRRDIVRFCSAP